jgi:hypothetical protein
MVKAHIRMLMAGLAAFESMYIYQEGWRAIAVNGRYADPE